jgi:hypothetical protein
MSVHIPYQKSMITSDILTPQTNIIQHPKKEIRILNTKHPSACCLWQQQNHHASLLFAPQSTPHHTTHTHDTKTKQWGDWGGIFEDKPIFQIKNNKSLMWLYLTSFYEFNNDGNLISLSSFLSHFRPEASFPIFVPGPFSYAFSDALYFCIFFLKFNLVIHLITLSTLLNINLSWH